MSTLVILDSIKYSKTESEIINSVKAKDTVRLIYTDYENRFIRLFHSFPFGGNFMSHITFWLISFIYAVKIFLLFRKKYEKKLFINPVVGFFYCGLKGIFRVKDNSYISGFLFVPKEHGVYYKIRKYLVVKAFKSADQLYVYSSKEPEYYSALLPELSGKFRFIRYGRNFNIFEEDKVNIDDRYIASGGASGRDFETLVKSIQLVSERIPGVLCIVATRPWSIPDVEPNNNLKYHFNIRPGSFGNFIDKSLFIILPLQNSALSSGHMTLLEALSRKKIVIVSEVEAIRDYVDEKSVIFYKPEDFSDLSSKILSVCEGIDSEEMRAIADYGHQLYLNNYTFEAFLNRLLTDINS